MAVHVSPVPDEYFVRAWPTVYQANSSPFVSSISHIIPKQQILVDIHVRASCTPIPSASDMNRIDNTDDEAFYSEPRFVTHIDDYAIQSLTEYYREELSALSRQKMDGRTGSTDGKVDVLDLCSSWISHLPESDNVPLGRVVGIGMNEKELEANKALTEYYVQNLNLKPSLDKFDDDSFDVVCNVVSVDYLTRPQHIFKETHRVLRPGGCALISFSNRCFPTKVRYCLQAQ